MAKSILKGNSTKMSNDIDDYLSDDFSDEDLTPPKDIKKDSNQVNGKKKDDYDDKYYDDLSYSDDDSLLSQERYENSQKASNEKKPTENGDVGKDRKMVNSDGPRAMSSEEEIRYFMDPLGDGDKIPVSAKTMLKTQDVRSLVTNQNKLLDNLGGMKRDIGNLDKEIDLIRSQIRSTTVINDATTPGSQSPSKSPTKSNSSSRRSSYGSSTKPSTVRTTSSRVPLAATSGIARLPVVETSRVRYSLGGSGASSSIGSLGSTRTSRSTLPGQYIPGSYIAGKTRGLSRSSATYSTVPRSSSVPPAPRIRYIPVGTVTVTTRPTSVAKYRRPVYLDDWDDMDETAIGTYLHSTSRPPHIGTLTNRIFDSVYSRSNLY